MSLLSILATISGIAMAFANFPQTYKIFRRKSAKDISLLTYLLFTLGSIIWLLYGFEIKNIPIVYTQSIGTLSCISVLTGWVFYK